MMLITLRRCGRAEPWLLQIAAKILPPLLGREPYIYFPVDRAIRGRLGFQVELAHLTHDPVELFALGEILPAAFDSPVVRDAEMFVILDTSLKLGQPQGVFGAVAHVGGIGILAVELACVEALA